MDEKKRRMEKVMQNREKRQAVGGKFDIPETKQATTSSSVSSPVIVASSPVSPEMTSVSHSCSTTTPAPAAVINVLSPSSPTTCPSSSNHQQVLNNETATNLLILSHLPGVAFNTPTSDHQQDFASVASVTVTASQDSQLVRRLTPEESHMIHELNQVYDLSFTVDLEPLVHIRQLDPSLNQLVNQSSITVLRLIKFAKRLEAFVRLSQACRYTLLMFHYCLKLIADLFVH